jgi:Uma2 family endonuclease
MTVDELSSLAEDEYRHELQAGALIAEPPPGFEHGCVVARIGVLLDGCVRSQRSGIVTAGDSGYLLARNPDTVRAPDLSFVCRERLAQLGIPSGVFPGAPDLAIEVRSPGNTDAELSAKVEDYLAAGTRLVWIVDPRARRVIVHRPLEPPVVLHEHDALDGGDVVPGFRVRVDELFPVS